uniref:Uncharacterized protein n=1 Tax=Quercus lobata TaxID=97700 RepID=A0A7N2LL89_QUELO
MIVYAKLLTVYNKVRATHGFQSGNNKVRGTTYNLEFAKLPFITPLLYPGYHQYTDGTNFASAGAGALAETNQGF